MGRYAAIVITAATSILILGCGTTEFNWVTDSPQPGAWPAARIPSGAAMPYPPGWIPAKGDRGTATAVLPASDGKIVGYLNITPRQGSESQANWTSFRPDHNADEGDRDVITIASASNLRFRTGTGACVQDSYSTSSDARYVEVACLVKGTAATTVIVGAATAAAWPRLGPQIERAVAAVST